MSRLDDLYRMRVLIQAEIDELEEVEDARLIRRPTETLQEVARLYCIDVEQILSTSREPHVVRARQAACWLLRRQGLSLPVIGRVVGRDHTTVLHACRKVEASPSVKALLWPLTLEAVA